MRVYSGIVTGQSIEKNRDGDQDVRMLQVEITEPDDIQTVQQVPWSGEDNAPVTGDSVVILEISETYKVVIGVQDQITPEVESGERKLYSQDNGDIKASIYLKKDGSIGIVASNNIDISNDNGNFSLNNTTGQFSVNDNFTVDV